MSAGERRDDLHAALAAGLLSPEETHRALLQSIVEVARAIFAAKASSIQLYDEATDELVFEAVAGEGADTLVGQRFPSSQGIAGWVLTSRQPLVIEDVSSDPRFAKDVAERTGFLPKGLMSVPLLSDERPLGVLQVLDRPKRPGFSLEEMNLLALFANQSALALEVVGSARRTRALVEGGEEELAVVARVAAAADSLSGGRKEAAVRLLRAIEDLLGR